VVGFVAAKIVLLFEIVKHFDEKFYYRGEKAGKEAKYLMLVSFQTNFVLSQIWILPLPSKPQ